MTPGQNDIAWLAAMMPDATENQIEWFCERVAMILQDELQTEDGARKDMLEVIRK